MPSIQLLDPTQKGSQAEHLESRLRRLVVGQDEAIHQIVSAYQRRAIERLLVQPMSNLMATSGQIQRGDCIRVSHEDGLAALLFGREPETAQAWAVAGRAA